MQKQILFFPMLMIMPMICFGQAATSKSTDASSADLQAAKVVSPLRKLIDETLTKVELVMSDEPTKPLTRVVGSIWANNARGSESGMTIFYVANGRPEVVCSIYPWQENLIQEFDSLSREKPIARVDGRAVWTPEKPGVQLQKVLDADPPHDTPEKRNLQLRVLSRRFTSTMLGWKEDKTDREELRLQPRPLFRYETKRKDILDGAVFAFTQGTDPETLLIIEAVAKGDLYEWQYAFVRNTSGELESRHDGKVVWHADRFPISTDARSVHFSFATKIDARILAELK